MARVVQLPLEIANRLDELTTASQDSTGVLFYRTYGEDCSIEAMFRTSLGDEHLPEARERMRIANEFIRRNAGYQYMSFHTHTPGAGEPRGKDYYKKQMADDSQFMALVVMPNVKLILGVDTPSLSVVRNASFYKARNHLIADALYTIAGNLGYEIKPLRGPQ
jgi:hypothetical protein